MTTPTWEDTTPFIPPITCGTVIKVYDGDTITLAAELLGTLYRFPIRLTGIDSPEIKGKSKAEKESAHISQHALSELILGKTVRLENKQQEKFGRILATVIRIEDSLNVNEWMLIHNFAVPYHGGTKAKFEA